MVLAPWWLFGCRRRLSRQLRLGIVLQVFWSCSKVCERLGHPVIQHTAQTSTTFSRAVRTVGSKSLLHFSHSEISSRLLQSLLGLLTRHHLQGVVLSQ